MNPRLNERDEKMVASILNPDSMLLGPAYPSAAALRYLIERLNKDLSKLDPKAIEKSLYYIAQSAQQEQAAKVIISIANNKELDPLVRQHAINSLGLLSPEYADTSLARALKEDKEVSQNSVLKAMAQVGGKDSLKTLQLLEPATDSQTIKLRAYAETMIALRLGEKISEEAEKRTLPTTTPFKFNEENERTLKQTISSIEGNPFGLELNEEFGFSFDCASCKHTILFNSNFKRGNFIRSITQAQIIGIIVMEDKASGRSVLRHAILLRPDKNATRVSVLRTNGDVAVSGELRTDGDNLSLLLRDLGTEVRPIQVNGKISNDEMELNADVFWDIAKTKLTGIPLN